MLWAEGGEVLQSAVFGEQRRYDLEVGALDGAAAIGEFETRVRVIR